MKQIITTLFLFASLFSVSSQSPRNYEEAFLSISKMLTGESGLNFKSAVFSVENAFFDNALDPDDFDQSIDNLALLTEMISETNLILYDKKDDQIIKKHASLFKVMTDTTSILVDSTQLLIHTPFTYDFEAEGNPDWSKMFVSKLLETGKGNCHSLPCLYKIVSDELGIPCYLAFAPNHLYIKLYAESTGWYNTELTSATFPVDAWIIASGYVNIDAIRNGLYMDTLSAKQAVAHCLVDLAQGYQYKYGKDDPEFVVKCCNTTLHYHPANVNAMLTKAEAQKHYIQSLMKMQNTENPKDLLSDVLIREMYEDMEATYVKLHQSGYRRMPEEMYRKWLELLKNEPDTYINPSVR